MLCRLPAVGSVLAPRVVYLHIGSTKTGTTFIQRVLWDNQTALRRHGVTLGGRRHHVVVQASRAMQGWSATDGTPVPEAWSALARRVNRSSAHAAVVSQEFLCWLDHDQIRAVVGSFDWAEVKVVLTVRDLSRVIPAQWASAMRQRHTWTLTEYADDVQNDHAGGRGSTPHQHFWRRLDYPAIVAAWAQVLGPANVTVVTVPPSGSDPDELWRRFSQACGLDPSAYVTAGPSNVSLGAASSELLRRLNALPAIQDMARPEYGKVINGVLIRRVMDQASKPETRPTLPEGQRAWVVTKTAEVVSAIEASGVKVIGSLGDLVPAPFGSPYEPPEDLPTTDLLDVALDALAGIAADPTALARAQRNLTGKRRNLTGRRRRFAGLPESVRRAVSAR